MFAGEALAEKLLNTVAEDRRPNVLTALDAVRRAQVALARADWESGLILAKEAEKALSDLPEARGLMGIVKADLSAALGNLGRREDARKYAEEGLALIDGHPELAKTRGSLRMNLGIFHFQNGNREESLRQFEFARNEFGTVPGGAKFVAAVDRNIEITRRKKWWEFGKR